MSAKRRNAPPCWGEGSSPPCQSYRNTNTKARLSPSSHRTGAPRAFQPCLRCISRGGGTRSYSLTKAQSALRLFLPLGTEINPSSSPTVLALLVTCVPDTTAEESLSYFNSKAQRDVSVSSRAAGAAPLLSFLRRRHSISSAPLLSRAACSVLTAPAKPRRVPARRVLALR